MAEQEQQHYALELQKLAVEKRKAVLGFMSTALTVLVGTFGVAALNHQYQQRQLDQLQIQNDAQVRLQKLREDADRRASEMKYLGEYIKYALDKDVQNRLRLAEYFSVLTISDDLQERWSRYHESLKSVVRELIISEEEELKESRAGNRDRVVEWQRYRAAMLAYSAANPVGKSASPAATTQPGASDSRNSASPVSSAAVGEISAITKVSCPNFKLLEPIYAELAKPHYKFAGSASWRLTNQGIVLQDDPTNLPLPDPRGLDQAIEEILNTYKEELRGASANHRVPVELLVALVATESRGQNRLVYLAGQQSDTDSPGAVSSALTGMNLRMARAVTKDEKLNASWLLNPSNSLDAAARFISDARTKTYFDPPLVAAQYNTGRVGTNDNPANRWKTGPGGGFPYIDRFVIAFNIARTKLEGRTDFPFSFAGCQAS